MNDKLRWGELINSFSQKKKKAEFCPVIESV